MVMQRVEAPAGSWVVRAERSAGSALDLAADGLPLSQASAVHMSTGQTQSLTGSSQRDPHSHTES